MYMWGATLSWVGVLPDWYDGWRETKEAEHVSKGVIIMIVYGI